MDTGNYSSTGKDEKIKQQRFISTSGLAKQPETAVGIRPEDTKPKLGSESRQKRPSLFAQRLASRKADAESRSPARKEIRRSYDVPLWEANTDTDRQKIEEIKASMQALGMIGSDQEVSTTDISTLREQVLRSLQPKNIAFMLSKKNVIQIAPDTDMPPELTGNSNTRGSGPSPEILEHFSSLQIVEQSKLEWMQHSKKTASNNTCAVGETEGRFDRSGALLSLKKQPDSTWIQGLHHHEQEMEKPGYTLEEYMHYARSTNSAQRSFALNSLAAIFRKAHYGLYEEALITTPLCLLCNVDVVSAIRVAMDYEDMISLDSALSCLAAMIYPDVEEESFDASFLFPDSQPCLLLKVVKEDSIAACALDPKFRDHQVLSIDLIDFLVFRSHILLRINYLLSSRSDRLSTSSKINILKILIRVARHSPIELVREISVLKLIRDKYVSTWTRICERPNCLDLFPPEVCTTCNSHSVLTWLSLKLFRVLSESSFNHAVCISSQLRIMKKVLSYIVESTERHDLPCQHGCLLLLESFRLWSTLAQKGLSLEEFPEVFPSCVATLRLLEDKEIAKFDAYYGAYLMLLLNKILQSDPGTRKPDQNYEKSKSLIEGVESLLLRISFRFLSRLSSSTSKDWELPLCSQCLYYLNLMCVREGVNNLKLEVSNAAKFWTLREVFKGLIPSSVILSSFRKGIDYPPNAIFALSVQRPGEPIAVVKHSSPFSLISRYLELLDILCIEDRGTAQELLVYVDMLTKNAPFEFCRSYFVKFELRGLCSMIQFLPSENLLLSFLLQLPCLLSQRDAKFFRLILQKAVTKMFSGKDVQDSVLSLYSICYFPNVDSEEDYSINEDFNTALESLVLFKPVAIKLVNSKFWMFDPLRRLCVRYMGKREDLKLYFDQVLNEVKTCLVFILETLSESSLFTGQGDLVTVYALVTQVFLLGEDVLTDAEVQDLLKAILKKYMLLWDVLNLSGMQYSGFQPGPSVPYILRFEEYYKDLVVEFESTSFGNDIFAAYLLMPLRAEESSELKLIFWSMSGLRFVRLAEKNGLVSLSFLLSEREKDKTLQKIYSALIRKNSVISDKSNPFLFRFLKEQQCDQM